jgi:hypothetical protein
VKKSHTKELVSRGFEAVIRMKSQKGEKKKIGKEKK